MYPAVSHTFIFREAQALRQMGYTIRTASVNTPQTIETMTVEEKEEAAQTLSLKATPPSTVLKIHLRLLFSHFRGYMRMFCAAKRTWKDHRLTLFKAVAYFAEAGILLAWMLDNDIEHVHVHFANPAATVAMLAASSQLVDFSLSVHGADEYSNAPTTLLQQQVLAATFVRCISAFCRSQLLSLAPPAMWDKFHVVRCGIDLKDFAKTKVSKAPLPEILCVGRLVPIKGHRILLEACRLLKDKPLQFHLTVIGDGPEKEDLEAFCRTTGLERCVTFTGSVGHSAIQAYYDRADIFALPSFSEGVPVVLMEAMVKGIPCVSTRIAGIPELIHDRENGLLVTPSEVQELTEALTELIANPALRAELGAKANNTVAARHDILQTGSGMAELFSRYAGAEVDGRMNDPQIGLRPQ
jgi:glycosyltransferase involved in cell wall biosynthesis